MMGSSLFFRVGRRRIGILWHYCMLLLSVPVYFPAVLTANLQNDVDALNALANNWEKKPSTWNGYYPCDNTWIGITCNNSRIIWLQLSTQGLKGTISGDIGKLGELQILDLSNNPNLTGNLPVEIGKLTNLTKLILVGCNFEGQIPQEIGQLQNLTYLALNSNKFSGNIPSTIGNLTNLFWLDMGYNKLSGMIPISDGINPGLDLLVNTKHFHFSNNQLSGILPPQLFNPNMKLIHILFDSNQLSGVVPSTLGQLQTLEILRLDHNQLNGTVPLNFNNLTGLIELHLTNNMLSGPLPDLTGMDKLMLVDMSNNSFTTTDVPAWFSTLQYLTSLYLEGAHVRGQIPKELLKAPNLQTLRLRDNMFNGTLYLGTDISSELKYIDLQNNNISEVTTGGKFNGQLILSGNIYCQQNQDSKLCGNSGTFVNYATAVNCLQQQSCPSDETLSPNCTCSYPFEGTFTFTAPVFSDFTSETNFLLLEKYIKQNFSSVGVAVESVSLQNVSIDGSTSKLRIFLKVFPSEKTEFNHSEVNFMGIVLSQQKLSTPSDFGPYVFLAVPYQHFAEAPGHTPSSSSSSNLGLIIGASVGGAVLLALLLALLAFVVLRRKASEEDGRSASASSFSAVNKSGASASASPTVGGTKTFTYEEIKKWTNNFSEENDIGEGGYGKVYKGLLPSGQLVAVKRAGQGSMQGGHEFLTEIELLSRVHHRNLVTLIGYCVERKEHILVYEYVPNGSLRDSLSGKSGVGLDWKRRLRISQGSAKGIAYLHELAHPPIIHRDIKSSNILLDSELNAKVSDFGLSKPLGLGRAEVTTQVKGTMGYLDPEYYMTQQLTDKSDVYSFGVLLLEMVTARKPLERGHYVVREVKNTMDRSKDLYALHELIDPALNTGTPLNGFERYIDLALRCVEEFGGDRPTMGEVVSEIESIMQLAGLNPHVLFDSSSTSYSSTSRNPPRHPYSYESSSDYSGSVPSQWVQAK